ncbi:MAG: glycosyltransferase family 2 protein [Deltaproteobacteria bacterium]|nr:MAG: glycosyltransferase family 2 protein [Deltaproteobacteria bacterium]
MEDKKISVYILTYNNEDTIEKCIKSALWADEIVILDHFSSDRTIEICRRYTDRIFQKEWTNYRDEYNYAIELTTNKWVMFLDSDEEVTPELADEIRRELAREEEWAGYLVPRMTHYLGRWIKHGGWYPDYKLRIFDKTRGRWEGKAFDPRVRVEGAVKKLRNPCLHYSFRNLDHHLSKMAVYTELFAEEAIKRGKKFGIWDLLLRPPLRFLRNYLLRGGFLDGIPGLVAASMASYYVFLKYAKIWEKTNIDTMANK